MGVAHGRSWGLPHAGVSGSQGSGTALSSTAKSCRNTTTHGPEAGASPPTLLPSPMSSRTGADPLHPMWLRRGSTSGGGSAPPRQTAILAFHPFWQILRSQPEGSLWSLLGCAVSENLFPLRSRRRITSRSMASQRLLGMGLIALPPGALSMGRTTLLRLLPASRRVRNSGRDGFGFAEAGGRAADGRGAVEHGRKRRCHGEDQARGRRWQGRRIEREVPPQYSVWASPTGDSV